MVPFSNVILYVKDVAAAVSFYQHAFDVELKFMHEGGQYAEMNTGTTVLAFASETLAASNLPDGFIKNDVAQSPQACELVFTVADVQAYYDRALAAGAFSVARPQQKPWGQTVAYVREPQGVLIDIASPVE